MNTLATELLKDFINDENAALLEERQGHFFPANHHRILPLIPKALKLLPVEQRQRFYFHLLRLGSLPPIKAADEWPILSEAYRQVLPLFASGYPAMLLSRATGLLLFGFDSNGSLPDEPPGNLESYAAHLRLWRYLNGFSHIPGMLAKQKKFQELAADPASLERIRKTLAHIRYCNDEAPTLCLWFWAMIFVALSAPATAETTVRELLEAHAGTAEFERTREILRRYIAAAGRQDLLAIVGS